MTHAASLLSEDEPVAFEFVAGSDASPFMLIADHAGGRVPRALGNLGLSPTDLESHIAWDIGIEGTCRHLARLLGASCFFQRYSRLVIDCNRPLDSADSVVERSAGIDIVGNVGLMPSEVEQRRACIFRPYHGCIERELDRRRREGVPTIFMAMHSFTPFFMGKRRPWHVGVMYQRDARIARRVMSLLQRDSTLVVGDNQPYAVSDFTDYSIIQYGERRGLPHVEIEIRQDLIEQPEGQQAWAVRFENIFSKITTAIQSAT